MNVLDFETFKEMVAMDNHFREKIISRTDIVDFDNGTMTIYAENINKYLEQFSCKDIDDLQDTLWFNQGVFVKVIN